MSAKIRLSRGGAKKRPYYYVVVAHSASPRDGRYIEQIGTFNPMVPKDQRRAREADRRPVQVLAVGWRTADGSRRAPVRCRRPSEARAAQQPREVEAEEEGAGARRCQGQGCRGSRRALLPVATHKRQLHKLLSRKVPGFIAGHFFIPPEDQRSAAAAILHQGQNLCGAYPCGCRGRVQIVIASSVLLRGGGSPCKRKGTGAAREPARPARDAFL